MSFGRTYGLNSLKSAGAGVLLAEAIKHRGMFKEFLSSPLSSSLGTGSDHSHSRDDSSESRTSEGSKKSYEKKDRTGEGYVALSFAGSMLVAAALAYSGMKDKRKQEREKEREEEEQRERRRRRRRESRSKAVEYHEEVPVEGEVRDERR